MNRPATAAYHCTACGAQFLRWTGRCTECGKWSTVAEGAAPGSNTNRDAKNPTPRTASTKIGSFAALADKAPANARPTGHAELDRVVGGGLVAGSVTLLGGEPGIGKSTILAQCAVTLAATGKRILYVTGEESPSQVALRLKRLSKDLPKTIGFLDETDAATVAATLKDVRPDLLIVDSIQTLRTDAATGEAGSPTQVRACGAIVAEAAKSSNIPVILVGQVTKDGDLAGPRLLEHLVDTVLMLEGDRNHRFRILRARKHRFGPTDDVAVLAMAADGLVAVEDPSAELLRDRAVRVPGSVITCLMEGHRPMLMELQALVHHAGYGTPVRRATGFDASRLGVLIAVLVRRAGMKLQDRDVYANAAGGLSAHEPAADLALCLAIASAVSDVPVDRKTAAFGEIGLGGELRPVAFPELRAKEAARHGFTTLMVPKGSGIKDIQGLVVLEVATLREAVGKALGK